MHGWGYLMQRLMLYPQLDSTNRLARELVREGSAATGTVIQAERQSAGRGQYERSFFSPPGGLYFSLILRPALPAQEIPLVTLAAGLGCRDALLAQSALPTRIKWPNDLYCGNRKIAGILSEYCQPGEAGGAAAVVVGVGMNVNSRLADFPEELRLQLGTVRECCGAAQDMTGLLEACVAAIGRRVQQLLEDRPVFFAQWSEADYLRGRELRHMLREKCLASGVGQGIDAQGRYLLRDDEGRLLRILGGQLRPLAVVEEKGCSSREVE